MLTVIWVSLGVYLTYYFAKCFVRDIYLAVAVAVRRRRYVRELQRRIGGSRGEIKAYLKEVEKTLERDYE